MISDLKENTMQKICLATHNPEKIKEISALVPDFDWVMPSDSDIEENGTTFAENALLKARNAVKTTHLPAVGDDSGICIHALDNKPGIFTKRHAEQHGGFPAVFAEINRLLENKSDKTAHFTCALAYVLPDGKEYVFEGYVFGRLITEARGNNGMGYDPVFIPDGETRTFAEMVVDEKNQLSHRSQAIKKFYSFIKNSKETTEK